MSEEQPRLIGTDGELVVPVAVEKPKRQSGNPNLTCRVLLLVLILMAIFGGAALVVVARRINLNVAAPAEPAIAKIPSRFVGGPYGVTLDMELDAKVPVTLPCESRRIRVIVDGDQPVKIRLWSSPNHGTVDATIDVTTRRNNYFDIPDVLGDIFNIWMLDTQGNPISGVEAITFGTDDFPICQLLMTFKSAGT